MTEDAQPVDQRRGHAVAHLPYPGVKVGRLGHGVGAVGQATERHGHQQYEKQSPALAAFVLVVGRQATRCGLVDTAHGHEQTHHEQARAQDQVGTAPAPGRASQLGRQRRAGYAHVAEHSVYAQGLAAGGNGSRDQSQPRRVVKAGEHTDQGQRQGQGRARVGHRHGHHGKTQAYHPHPHHPDRAQVIGQVTHRQATGAEEHETGKAPSEYGLQCQPFLGRHHDGHGRKNKHGKVGAEVADRCQLEDVFFVAAESHVRCPPARLQCWPAPSPDLALVATARARASNESSSWRVHSARLCNRRGVL